MMNAFLQDKAHKQRFFQKGLIAILALIVIFGVFVVRFALSGSRDEMMNGAPGSDDAYKVAKQFIRPTIKYKNISFPETGYQCAEKPDSIFVVKSYAEAKGQPGSNSITSFEITLKFVGGNIGDKRNWRMLRMSEN